VKSVLIAVLRGYQLLVRPLLGMNCRFYPSCSDYAKEAIDRQGAIAGSWLAARRVCRCHPYHPGGYDPVPDRLRSPRRPPTKRRRDRRPAWTRNA